MQSCMRIVLCIKIDEFWITLTKLEIRSVERGICPIVTLYSLAAAYKGGTTIFHGGRVVSNFVPKFVAMATGVGREEILTTPSDSPGPKIGGRCKQRAIIFYGDRVIPL